MHEELGGGFFYELRDICQSREVTKYWNIADLDLDCTLYAVRLNSGQFSSLEAKKGVCLLRVRALTSFTQLHNQSGNLERRAEQRGKHRYFIYLVTYLIYAEMVKYDRAKHFCRGCGISS